MPTLTLNAGVRWDTENFYGLDPTTGPFKAFAMENQWSPRVGVVWDFVGDGTSKLYASAGRFYFSLPTDLNVRVFTANSAVQTYNYTPGSIIQDPNAPRSENFQGGTASGEPVDGWTNGVKNGTPLTKAAYQDELTLGVEKAIDPSLSLGLKGTYRTLGRTVEDRCDLNGAIAPNTCALFNPGGDGQAASGQFPTCNGSGNPTDPSAGECSATGVAIGDAKRIFRGIEMTARKQFTNAIWAQASFLYSSLKGNYSGAIRQATGQTDPGINADYDYYQFTFNDYGNLELDRPVQARIDAVYNAPFGLSAGAQFYVRSGLPISRLGWFNDFYPANLYLEERGTFGRTPTDYDLNLSLGYNMALGPGDAHPAALRVQRPQPPDDRCGRQQLQLRRRHRHGSDEPVLRPAGSATGNGHLRGLGHGSLLGQPGLPQDGHPDEPPAAPRRAQGHVLRPHVFPCSPGGGASRPHFFEGTSQGIEGGSAGSRDPRRRSSRSTRNSGRI